MPSTYLTDQQYTSFIAMVAELNGCRLEQIDFESRTIKLSGIKESLRICSQDLEKILGVDTDTEQYAVS